MNGDSQTIIATEGSATCFAGLAILTAFAGYIRSTEHHSAPD